MSSRSVSLHDTILIVSVIIVLLVSFIGFVLVLYYYRRKKLKEQQAELKEKFTQILLQSQLEIREQTLQYVSSELHDNLGQIASLIKINLNTLQLEDTDQALLKIEDTKDLTRQLISDIRALSISLGANRIGQVGIANALEAELKRLNRTGHFVTQFRCRGLMPEIDDEKTIILFRMSQEILNNIIKHSQAKQVTVSADNAGNSFILVFTDDGVGYDREDAKNHRGAGMLNLENRAKMINARIFIETRPMHGTKVTIELPI